MLHVFKRSCNAHITLIFRHFTVYAYWALEFFCKKNPLNFYFKTRNHFRDEITRLVINTRLITTLKNVDMFKIIEFYWFMHTTFCSWKCFENFITRSLEDGFLCGARFSKWQLFSQYTGTGTCIMNECLTDAISWCFSESRCSRERRLEGRRRREVELQERYVIP